MKPPPLLALSSPGSCPSPLSSRRLASRSRQPEGKSTILRALAVGVYDKVPGDGREFVVSDPGAVTVRAEDGRPVSGLDISAFISALPCAAPALAEGMPGSSADTQAQAGPRAPASPSAAAADGAGNGEGGEAVRHGENSTERFSTGGASGSTSQAANVMEALEAGATALLLDEDTCAGNVSRGGPSGSRFER